MCEQFLEPPPINRARSNSDPSHLKNSGKGIRPNNNSDKKAVEVVARTDHGTVVIKNDVLKLAQESKQPDPVFRCPFLPNTVQSINTSIYSTSLPLKHSAKKEAVFKEPQPVFPAPYKRPSPTNKDERAHATLVELLYGNSIPQIPFITSAGRKSPPTEDTEAAASALTLARALANPISTPIGLKTSSDLPTLI
ncbi:hypothetical protein CRE_16796 [Caenorhabditis remanei]|uniref:Uncharacterized protein n=1 Tax=Caenorhabditis remanei TaxID=31234 RepID=E3MB57_CAERE|nr:hypothetical protein CRE_16796 [Caenorhabditis remanei]